MSKVIPGITTRSLSLRHFALIGLALWSVISIGMVVKNTLSASGGNDLYTYWLGGHFIRQGDDPYQAFMEKWTPDLPVHYLDKDVTQLDEIIQPELVPAPGYTYPFLLFFTVFAFFSWETAKWVWLAVNLCFAVVTPILAVRILPKSMSLPLGTVSTIAMVFFGFSATRYALSSGQVTFLVLDLMILAVLISSQKPWLAGILLGLALSKYSVSAGFLLFYVVVNPSIIVVASALAVQAMGVLFLMVLSHRTFYQVLTGYTVMFEHHAPMDGIHLASLFPVNNLAFDLAIAGLLSLAVIIPLLIFHKGSNTPQGRLAALVVLMSWSLLVAYHRAYDAVSLIFLLVLSGSILSNSKSWKFSPNQETVWRAFSLVGTAIMLLPAGSTFRSLIPEEWGWWWVYLVGRLPTFVAILGLVGSLWIFYQLAITQPTHQLEAKVP